jgi:heptosyltransferase-2
VRIALRLPNWVGDVMMALPALARLHADGVSFRCYGRGWTGDLLAAMPYEVETIPRGIRAGAAVLRHARADAGLLMTDSFSSAAAMRWAGIAAVGYRRDFRGLLLGSAVAKPTGIHRVKSYLHLIDALYDYLQRRGWERPSPATDDASPMRLELHARHVAEAERALTTASVASPFVVLCPLATGTIHGVSRRWTGFPELCERLRERGVVVVACPGPGEDAETRAALPGAVVLEGVGLGAFAAVMARARLVVSNDSGPLHLGAAAGARMVGLHGVTDPSVTAPWSPAAVHLGGIAEGWPDVESVWRACASSLEPGAQSRAVRAE